MLRKTGLGLFVLVPGPRGGAEGSEVVGGGGGFHALVTRDDIAAARDGLRGFGLSGLGFFFGRSFFLTCEAGANDPELYPPFIAFQSEQFEQMFPGQLHWTVTAGNSSQISDGASAVLIASREKAEQLGLTPRARFLSFALAGDSPILMLTAPIPATRRVLERARLTLDDIDVVEINEAFASVVLAWQRELGVADDWFEEHVNPNGGAIAVGHPLGATGAKLMTTMLHELDRRGGRYGLQTMCEGGGLANATIIERLS